MRGLALLVAVALVAQVGAGARTQAAPLVERFDAFMRDYEAALSSVVARESFEQRVYAGGDARMRRRYNEDAPPSQDFSPLAFAAGVKPNRQRVIESDVAFIALPGDAGWLGVRHVQAVDGAAVRGSGRSLESLLARGWASASTTAMQLLADSAKHNLGSPRTINLPNLPLELLHARHRDRFRVAVEGDEEIDGVRTTRVVFDEQRTPSLIQGTAGGNLMSTVTAWLEPDTGKLRRAEVRSLDRRPSIRAFQTVIRVEFRDDPGLALLVPTEMRERFFVDPFDVRGGVGVGIARYDRFRRFGTAARVRPPG